MSYPKRGCVGEYVDWAEKDRLCAKYEQAIRERDAAEATLRNARDALAFYANPFGRKDEWGDPVMVPDFYDEINFGEYAQRIWHDIDRILAAADRRAG